RAVDRRHGPRRDRSIMSRARSPRAENPQRAGPIMPQSNPYERHLDRSAANYTPLTPLSLIARTAYTYPHRLAVVHGDRRYTWAETYARCRRLASALVASGIGIGDTVRVLA